VLHSNTSSTSVSFSAQNPPFFAGVMLRFRTIKPPPHSCVHSEKALQSETSQSSAAGVRVGSEVGFAEDGTGVGFGVGQANMLHVIVSVVLPHFSPPSTKRSRVLVPPAQSAVHSPHSSHSPSTHSAGQSSVLHSITSSTSVSFTAQEPPYFAGVIVRCRIIKPPPQGSVHFENAPHSETSQS
jgi:hypothetical protein